MKNFKLSRRLFWFTYLFHMAYNGYFGWNEKPINDIEATFDIIRNILFGLSFYYFIKPLILRYKYLVYKWESEKTISNE